MQVYGLKRFAFYVSQYYGITARRIYRWSVGVFLGPTHLTPPVPLSLHPLHDGLDGVRDLDTLRALKEEFSPASRAPTVMKRTEGRLGVHVDLYQEHFI